MAGTGDAQQAVVDGTTARALAAPTRRVLLARLVAADTPLTVADLAAASGVHHTTVRSHLAALERAGLVRTTVEERHTRGRPRTFVEPTPAAITALGGVGPYERLAVLLATVTRTGATPSEVGRDAGRSEAARRGGATTIDHLEQELRRQGFEPRCEHHEDRTVLVLAQCPFASAAELDPTTVCAIHEGWAEGYLEGTPGVVVDGLTAGPARRAGCTLTLRGAPPS